LKGLADEHDIDVGMVAGGLCDWVFYSADYKVNYQIWLDKG
jgi:hypothetical protein